MRNVERAKQIAKSKGVSFAFVCTQIGKSRGYLAEILANNRDIPEKMLEPVAQALGVSVSELTGEEQKEKPNALDGIGLENLSPARRALLEKLDGMNDDQIMKLISVIDSVLEVTQK